MFKLVVGLGNVGSRYQGTRHNLGFEVLNRVAEKLKVKELIDWPDCRVAETKLAGESGAPLLLAWPTTYMNRSGRAVEYLMGRLDLTQFDLLVVVDDFNLSLGRLRFRSKGSDGGHNGLASIIETLESDEFARLRLGIGPLEAGQDVIEYVLSRFPSDQADSVERMVAKAAEAVIFAATCRLEEAMAQFNSSSDPALPID